MGNKGRNAIRVAHTFGNLKRKGAEMQRISRQKNIRTGERRQIWYLPKRESRRGGKKRKR